MVLNVQFTPEVILLIHLSRAHGNKLCYCSFIQNGNIICTQQSVSVCMHCYEFNFFTLRAASARSEMRSELRTEVVILYWLIRVVVSFKKNGVLLIISGMLSKRRWLKCSWNKPSPVPHWLPGYWTREYTAIRHHLTACANNLEIRNWM